MNPVTVRRLLVFGVCALGVTSLYLAPSFDRSNAAVSGGRSDDGPPAPPVSTAGWEVSVTPTTSVEPSRDGGSSASDSLSAAPQQAGPPAVRPASVRRPPVDGATPFDPAAVPDQVAPAPVGEITSARLTHDRLSISWPAASDDVAVVAYRVWLNGFEVATTPRTSVTVRWFNDDADEHVLQVKALDAAGNLSDSSPTLLVARPTPEPTPAPGTPTETPRASSTPTPAAGPSTTEPTADESTAGPTPEATSATALPVVPEASPSSSTRDR